MNISEQPPSSESPKGRNTLLFQRLAQCGYIGLLIWVVLWHFVLETSSPYSNLFITLFWVIPLLLPFKGLMQGKPYTYAWANFVVLLYFMHGLTAIYTDPQWYYAFVELVFATAMFVGCCYYARLRGRELGLKLKKLSDLP